MPANGCAYKRALALGVEDLALAVDLADREPQLNSWYRASLLDNYAALPRKVHQRQQARAVEKRAAMFRGFQTSGALVDVSELRRQSEATGH